jgi:hypothetical protein
MIFRIFIVIILISLPLAAAAVPEPKCKKNCLKEGHYSISCDAICEADESLGHPFNIARKQYNCMTRCNQPEDKTLMQCIIGCRQKVRDMILSSKENRINKTIAEVDAMLEKKDSEIENNIDERVHSKQVTVEKPTVLVIQ